MAIGQPEAMQFMVGGPTSSGGPATGIYRVLVADATIGQSKGQQDDDGNYTKPPRPYVELEFHGKGDDAHPSFNGKKVIKQRFYSPLPSDDKEKQKMMAGMVKRALYDGLGLKWNNEQKALDPRIFTKKECFIAIGPGKPSETGESRQEVQAISLKREKLPKKFLSASEQKSDEKDGEKEEKETTSTRRR